MDQNSLKTNTAANMKTKTGLTPELAKKEVEKWLDIKRVRPKKREKLKDQISLMCEFFEDGTFILNDDGKIVQNLLFETGGKKELVYESRLSINKLNEFDHQSHYVNVVSALTGELTGVIAGLDSEDTEPALVITSFF